MTSGWRIQVVEDPRLFLKGISIDFLGDREGCSMGLSKIFWRSLNDSTGLPRRFWRSWEIVKVFLEDSASQKQTSCSWDGRINLSFSFSTWFCSFLFASPSFFLIHCRFWERHHGPRRPIFFLPLSLPAECFLLLIIPPLLLGRGIMGLSKEWGSVTIFACDKLGRIRHAPGLGNRCR